jgi:protocatechuate 3,4-dioxygenase beta subunit
MINHNDDHDGGLVNDLELLRNKMLERRRALQLLGYMGATGVLLGSGVAAAKAACIADPAETSGPYPADGTNNSSGVTSDILTRSGIVRSDIRRSFISTSTLAVGVPVRLTLTLVNTKASCAALAGYAVYLWHCDRNGHYSLYSAPTESYLRGVQVTNALGRVKFTTIFPACYSGRWPHMHFEIFKSRAVATTGRNAVLTSQLAMPQGIATTVYNKASGYNASVSNLKQVSLADDPVFGDNTYAQLTAMTPTMTGSVTDGYTATATIGLAG